MIVTLSPNSPRRFAAASIAAASCQPSSLRKHPCDHTGMSATAKCPVDVDSVRSHVQRINRLSEEDRCVSEFHTLLLSPAHVSTPLETRGSFCPYAWNRSLQFFGNSAIRPLPTAIRHSGCPAAPYSTAACHRPLPYVRQQLHPGFDPLTGRYPARQELLWTRRCHLPTSHRCTSLCSTVPLSSWNLPRRPLSASRQTPSNFPG